MNDKEILAGAPDGATHIEVLASTKVYYLKKDKNGMGYAVFISNEWTTSMAVTGYVRSLADIARIVELEKERDAHARQAHRFAVFLCKTVEKLDGIPEFEPTKQMLSRLVSGNELQAHNLEQQAKGIKDFVANYCGDNMDFSQAERRIENLHNQANQLRAEVGTLQDGDE